MKPDIATMSDAELRDEMRGYLGDKPAQRWRWVWHEGQRITWPEFRADGTAHAEGITERTALEALVSANRRQHERRSKAASKAADTRARRRERLVYEVAQRLKDGGTLTPSARCIFCRRALSDAESRARGIGAECWQGALKVAEGMA